MRCNNKFRCDMCGFADTCRDSIAIRDVINKLGIYSSIVSCCCTTDHTKYNTITIGLLPYKYVGSISASVYDSQYVGWLLSESNDKSILHIDVPYDGGNISLFICHPCDERGISHLVDKYNIRRKE